MKKTILGLVFIIMAFVGSANVYAASKSMVLTTYSFSNTSDPSSTSFRDKYTANRVYVNPTYGPTVYYTVRGRRVTVHSDGSWETTSPTNRS